MEKTIITLPPVLTLKLHLTDEQFFQLCHENDDLKFERTSKGELIIISPTGGNTGDRNSDINYQLRAWSRKNKLGKTFDSSTVFKLPSGADRSPDASWVKIEQWNALTTEEQDKFPPLCPDFVIELRLPSDSLQTLQNKMQEYIENGAQLGWLIDPKRKIVEIYRPHQEVEILQSPTTVSGESILPGFVLELTEIF